MPQVIVAILVYIGVSELVATIIAWALIALYGAYQIKKAKRGEAGGYSMQDTRSQTLRTPIGDRVTLYGQFKVGGVMTYLHNSSDNSTLHVLVTFAGHEIHAFREVYLNADRVQFDLDGNVVSKYLFAAKVWYGLGTDTSDAALLAELRSIDGGGWTDAHAQKGCAKLLLRFSYNQDLFPNGLPNITALVLGKSIYDPRTATTGYTNNAALCIRDYLLSPDGLACTTAELNDDSFTAAANTADELVDLAPTSVHQSAVTVDQLTTDASETGAAGGSGGGGPSAPWGSIYSGTILGLTADISPEFDGPNTLPFDTTISYAYTFVTAAGETTLSPASHSWTQKTPESAAPNNFALRINNVPSGPSIVTARKLYRSTEVDGSGRPINFKLLHTFNDNNLSDTFLDDGTTAVTTAAPTTNTTNPIRLRLGSQLYLPTGTPVQLTTTGTLPSPLATSTTYYWIYDFNDGGRLATTRANAIADTAITLTSVGSGTHTVSQLQERRYTCDGLVQSSQKPVDVLNQLLTSCAGKLLYIGGKWTLYVGAYRSPSGTLVLDDLDGSISVTSRLGRRSIFNGVKGVFFNPNGAWQETDFPPVVNATFLAQDAGERIWSEISLPMTSSASAAQRIGKILLEQARQQITVSLRCKLTALKYQAGDTVNLTIARYGWSAKTFEIVDYKLAMRSGQNNEPPSLGVDLLLRETASAVYDWDDGEETTFDPAPDTNLPDPFIVAAPTGVTLTNGTDRVYTQNDGTVIFRTKISWDQTADPYVLSGGQVEVHYRQQPSLTWEKSTAVPGGDTFTYLYGLQAPALYDIAVRYQNSLGVRSVWTVLTAQEVLGFDIPPPDVTNFVVNHVANLVRFHWDAVVDPIRKLDYELRLGESWDNGIILYRTAATDAPSFGDGTYWLAARSQFGGVTSYSTNPVSLTLTGTVLTKNVLASYEESPSWTGTVSGGALKVGNNMELAVNDVLDMADVLAELDVLTGGGVAHPGTYTLPTGHTIDLGRVAACQVVISYTAAGDDVNDNLFEILDLFAVTNLFHAGLGPEVLITPQLALAADDAVFGAWFNYFPGVYTGRYFRSRVILDTLDDTVFPILSQYSFAVDAPDRLDSYVNQALSAGGTTLTYTVPFNGGPGGASAPNVQVTILNATAGDDVLITASSLSSVTIQVKNAGSGVARNVNVIVQGY
jgi:hypothetical protein